MAGTSEGARKAAETNKKKYGTNFYRNIGGKSWSGERSHVTGFALDKDRASAAGRKGGKKTKNDYNKKKEVEYLTGEEFAKLIEPEELGTGFS